MTIGPDMGSGTPRPVRDLSNDTTERFLSSSHLGYLLFFQECFFVLSYFHTKGYLIISEVTVHELV